MLQQRELLHRISDFRKRKDAEYPSLPVEFMEAYADIISEDDDERMETVVPIHGRRWNLYKSYRVRPQH